MQTQDTWLSGPEAAERLAIRQSRLAQLCRVGIMPFKTGVDYILIHKRAVDFFSRQFPELLDYLRAENEVDKLLDAGELSFEVLNFPPEKVQRLLKSVELAEGSFPDRELLRGNLSFPSKFSA